MRMSKAKPGMRHAAPRALTAKAMIMAIKLAMTAAASKGGEAKGEKLINACQSAVRPAQRRLKT